MDKGNGDGCLLLASYYDQGLRGLARDDRKANELCLKAGELGCAGGYGNVGCAYRDGRGLARDMSKAKYYFELASIAGDLDARYNLGCLEGKAGNHHRAMKHFTIAARAGEKDSLEAAKKAGFMKGIVTKDEFANTLRSYQKWQNEMKSDERDKASKIKEEMRRSGFRA